VNGFGRHDHHWQAKPPNHGILGLVATCATFPTLGNHQTPKSTGFERFLSGNEGNEHEKNTK